MLGGEKGMLRVKEGIAAGRLILKNGLRTRACIIRSTEFIRTTRSSYGKRIERLNY